MKLVFKKGGRHAKINPLDLSLNKEFIYHIQFTLRLNNVKGRTLPKLL